MARSLYEYLQRSKDEFFTIVDLFASEYGWTIEYTQSLTLPEIIRLVRCISKRRKNDDVRQHNCIVRAIATLFSKSTPPDDEDDSDLQGKSDAERLVVLAKKLGASRKDIDKLQKGEIIKI